MLKLLGGYGGEALLQIKNPSYYNIVSGYDDSWYGAHLYINVEYEYGSYSTDGYFYPDSSGAVACFEEGTKVLTSNGLIPIEDINKGDYVLSRNEQGAIEEQKVYHTYNHNPRSCL